MIIKQCWLLAQAIITQPSFVDQVEQTGNKQSWRKQIILAKIKPSKISRQMKQKLSNMYIKTLAKKLLRKISGKFEER